MGNTRERVPAHLRSIVVEQDYDRYSEIDQAVWRFVLLQTYSRLRKTAHPAYAAGLGQTGMSVERIPRISEMDEHLSRYGWGTVCVDGFIPPRAFTELQSLRILPIAADIRTARHLAYTPAPDIIHEAAGHAPILVDPEYAAFLERIGAVSTRAFGSEEDRRVYDAIFALSEIKEDPAATPARIAAMERRLEGALSEVTYVSEAARLARLYWWTAEYGLVGRVDDYRIYGAGLLSSLGESHFCHDPSVRKVPLDAGCVEVGYDITRPQPQLFVARDFAQLVEVVEEVAGTLAFHRGGLDALREAERSRELATVELDSGVQVTGVVSRVLVENAAPIAVAMTGPWGLALPGGLLAKPRGQGRHLLFPVGRLEGGVSLPSLADRDLAARAVGDGRLALRYASGIIVEGTLRGTRRTPDRRLRWLDLAGVRVRRGDALLHASGEAPYLLPAGDAVRTAFPGAAHPDFLPPADFPSTRVPKSRTHPPEERELVALYEEAVACWHAGCGSGALPVFERIHRLLVDRFPDEWLLRWNLLECLLKAGQRNTLGAELEAELESLEARFSHVAPIASGLGYLRRCYGEGRRSPEAP